ncbi:MAG: hypothetical protein IKE01_01705 [Clostridia bacterium]|nr:hypothetical protein [Clostridia bacterium]
MSMVKKSIAILAVMLLTLVAFATKSQAVTKAELQEYMCTEKDFTGTKIIIRDADKVKLESFFKKVDMTDEQATKIKGYMDEAIKYMNDDGAKSPSKLSSKEKKNKLLQIVKDAAAVLNMTVKYDASEERLDIFDENGEFIDSLFWGVEVKSGKGTTESKLIQTGSTNYAYVAVAGVVLVAGITFIVARKNAAKANA